MKASVEITSGVLRAGETHDGYGTPYELSAAFSCVDGKTAVIKALTSDGRLTPAFARAAFRALEDLGLKPEWERFK